MAREDVISRMRSDISVQVVSDFGASQDFQAFRITYSGRDARLVAQVTNELASLFIEENMKAREQQATGTTEFLQNQLQETRKDLEAQETKLRQYKLQHVGEMPEQQTADLQILGQLQSQLQIEGDALSRAEQSKMMLQSMLAQSAPAVVDLDDGQPKVPKSEEPRPGEAASPQARVNTQLRSDKARLASLLARYLPDHPDVRKLKKQIEREEAAEAVLVAADAAKAEAAKKDAAPPVEQHSAQTPAPPPARAAAPPANHVNPVIQSQLNTLEAEIAKHKEESQRLTRQVAQFQAKLSAIPVREQEIVQLVRDYEMSKDHYNQLMGQQLSAETATQLEIRQKGEKFEVLDPAQVAERPSRPNRTLINGAGAIAGLVLGLILALVTEVLGISITSPEDLGASVGVPVLEVIPLILTRVDRRRRTKRILVSSASALATILVVCVILFYRSQA